MTLVSSAILQHRIFMLTNHKNVDKMVNSTVFCHYRPHYWLLFQDIIRSLADVVFVIRKCRTLTEIHKNGHIISFSAIWSSFFIGMDIKYFKIHNKILAITNVRQRGKTSPTDVRQFLFLQFFPSNLLKSSKT